MRGRSAPARVAPTVRPLAGSEIRRRLDEVKDDLARAADAPDGGGPGWIDAKDVVRILAALVSEN